MVTFLEKMRRKQEERQYQQMMIGSSGPLTIKSSISEGKSSAGSALNEAGVGLNILVLMATGFILFWYAGRSIFPSQPIMPTICGLVGMIGAMILETLLLIIRDQKQIIQSDFNQKWLTKQTDILHQTHKLRTQAALHTKSDYPNSNYSSDQVEVGEESKID